MTDWCKAADPESVPNHCICGRRDIDILNCDKRYGSDVMQQYFIGLSKRTDRKQSESHKET